MSLYPNNPFNAQYVNTPVVYETINVDNYSTTQDGQGIKIQNNTTGGYVEVTPSGIELTNDGINIYNVNLFDIIPLETPPNTTTLKVNDTILLDNNTDALTINPNNITFNTASATAVNISNNNSQALVITGDGALTLNATQTNLSLNATAGDINTNVGNGNINLDAYNVNSFNFATPICFEARDTGSIVYGGGQALTLVYQFDLTNLPHNFFTENPNSGYTSNIWRINFNFLTYENGGGDNNGDKARTHYIMFEDQNGNPYMPFAINDITPFAYHNNNSTWTAGGPVANIIPFCWSDYVDFSPLGGTGAGNFPLRFKLFMGSDNAKDFTFKLVLGLTRTNLL